MDINKSDFLTYTFFLITSIQYGLVYTELEISGLGGTAIMGLLMLIFLTWVIYQKFSIATLLKLGALIGVAVITYIQTSETVFMVMILSAIIASRTDFTDLMMLILRTRFIILCFIISLAIVGVLPMAETSIVKGGTQFAVTGYGLGYNHPNQFAMDCGFLLLLYIATRRILKTRHIIFVTTLTLMVYAISKSRTIVLVMLFVGLLLFLCKNKHTNKFFIKIVEKYSKWFMPICVAAALGLPMLMSSVNGNAKIVLYAINGIMGSRFTHSARVFENYKVPLFGGVTDFDILENLYQYSIVDNGYLRLLYNFGIVGFVIFLCLYFFTVKKMVNQNKIIWIVMIMAISMWGITESVLRSFAFNFTPLFWGILLGNISTNDMNRNWRRIRK